MNQWHKCYDDSWQGIIVPEAFAHPAKMSYGLTKRIFKHALSEAWIKPGDVVVDPFGGIGSTGIIGAYADMQVICCELEAKFCKLAQKNFDLHIPGLKKLNHPIPVIIQGDSRKLSEVIGKADCLVGSPPFQGVNIDENLLHGVKVNRNTQCVRTNRPKNIGKGQKAQSLSYGTTPGQLGAMKPGSVEAIISSPPYANAIEKRSGPSGLMGGTFRLGKSDMQANKEGYSKTPGNLGNLKPGSVDAVVSSPPYAGALGNRKHEGDQQKYLERQKRYNKKHPEQKRPSAESMCYPCSDGNIAALKPGSVEAIISSPPFENTEPCQDDNFRLNDGRKAPPQGQGGYGKTNGNIGNDKGETFWQAAKQIVSECHKILKPGGHAIWVVKAFVRKGKIVDFPGDWRRLCESQGFTTVCEHHAMLVKETRHNGLFEEIIETKERKSFFRRLAEKKGSPKIDYEVVLCMRK